MVLASMRCPKCGLVQMAQPTCKSCGAVVDSSAASPEWVDTGVARPRGPSTFSASEPAGLQESPWRGERGMGEVRRLFFHGTGGSLFGIQIVNIFLMLLTLGIYSFWAKVRVRRYLMGQMEFEGDRFAYHGTGKELLIGFLKAMLIFGVPVSLLNVLPELLGAGMAIKVLAGILLYLIVLVFIPFAMVGTRRYRLSRSSWRAIRFSFRGKVADFIKLFVSGSLLTPITLGLYYPFFETKRYGFMISHSHFGNQKFHFDGQGRDLFGSYLLALLLFFPTLGLYWIWFLAQKQRYFWDHTSFGTARFHCMVTGGRLLVLYLGNVLLLLVTLGFAWPWVSVRNIRFAFAYLSVEGPLDFAVVQQEAQAASATGEGLAGFLDADFDLG